jgi:hypothetical protein
VTPLAIVWIAAISLWAGILALVGIAAVRRAFTWHHSHGRAPAQEPPSPATAAPRETVPLRLVRLLVHRRQPTPHVGEVHEGATEDFGGELRALRDAPVSPELAPVLTEVEIRTEVHDQLDKVMADFRHDLDHILDGICRRLDPLWARVDYPTGEMSVVREAVAA